MTTLIMFFLGIGVGVFWGYFGAVVILRRPHRRYTR